MREIVRLRIMQILAHHRGRPNAIPRRELIDKLRHYCIDLEDRKVREAYALLPICSSESGLFIPTTTAEVQAFAEYLRPHMGPDKIAARVGIIYSTWPALTPAYGVQSNLFAEGAGA
jgi:hypothetical protein